MDAARFDRIARALASAGSRRRLLRGLVAAPAVGLFGGLAPRREPDGAALAADQEIDYFALGDSVASGHGLMPTKPERDGTACQKDGTNCCHPDGGEPDGGNCCRRSTKAYPHKVADRLRQLYAGVNFPDAHHIACSGASSAQLAGQVDQVLARTTPGRPALVSITLGANDFHWADPFQMYAWLVLANPLQFQNAKNDVVGRLKKRMKNELLRLLAKPEVRVVVTQQHNPFNKESVFIVSGAKEGAEKRAGELVEAMAQGLREVVAEIDRPTRLAFAGGKAFHSSFREHASPRYSCGDAEPHHLDTWIQFRNDTDSNSFYDMPKDLGPKQFKGTRWRGDCFHPNEKGAQQYANLVLAAARRLGFNGNAVCVAPGVRCQSTCQCVSAKCPHGQVWNRNTCACGCRTEEQEICDGKCFNLCSGGKERTPANGCLCTCPESTDECGGSCHAPCEAPLVRDPNTCQCGCPKGTEFCGGGCVDPASCACGCPNGTTCQGGICRCSDGRGHCDGQCCASGKTCTGKICCADSKACGFACCGRFSTCINDECCPLQDACGHVCCTDGTSCLDERDGLCG